MKTPYWFFKKRILAWMLLPFSILYYLTSKIVYGCRRIRQKTSKRPVICVGNILSGGVGKTPIVMEIAKRLDSPVVMRGYKKSAHTGGIGDEAKMLSNAGLCVHIGDRWSNVVLLNKQKSDTPIIMDDGFQNPKIKKNISILVFDEGIGLGNGFLLPAGPLREPISAIQRADAVIIIRSNKANKKFKIKYDLPVFYATNTTINPYNKNTNIVAFAGIGYPKKFFNSINAVKTRAFPDHYQYTDVDLDKLFAVAKKENAELLTTEKDWVRLPKYAQDKIKFAALHTVIENSFWKWIQEKINENI